MEISILLQDKHYMVPERKPRFFGQKLEIRISKYETMTEIKNVPMTKTLNFQRVRFDHFVIWYSNLFRVSSFGFGLNMTFRSDTIWYLFAFSAFSRGRLMTLPINQNLVNPVNPV